MQWPWQREQRENRDLQRQFEQWLDELTADGAPWTDGAPPDAADAADTP